MLINRSVRTEGSIYPLFVLDNDYRETAAFSCNGGCTHTHMHLRTNRLLNKAVFDVREEYFWHERSPF